VDAPDDGVVHYNAIRVAASTIDTGDFLRDAAAAAPRYITSPVRPSPFQSSSVAASPLHVASHLSTSLRPAPTKFGVCHRPVWASRRSSHSSTSAAVPPPASASAPAPSSGAPPPSASGLAFPAAARSPASRSVYHVQPSTPVWENEADWFERAFCLNGFPFGRGGPSEYSSTSVTRAECLSHYMRLLSGLFQAYEYVLHAYDVQARTKMASGAFEQAKITVFCSARCTVLHILVVAGVVPFQHLLSVLLCGALARVGGQCDGSAGIRSVVGP
jgi:hypothetical protein